jgi:hypothetical protein
MKNTRIYFFFLHSACFLILSFVSYGVNAQEPTRRIAGFEPARVLKTFGRLPWAEAKWKYRVRKN